MSEKVGLIKTVAEIAFDRFDRATKDLSESEINWRPVEAANSIGWILMHLSQQWNVGIPRILKGDPEYKPKDWPEDYVGDRSYSLKKIKADLENGKSTVMSGLEELSPKEAETEIPLWGGTRKLQDVVLLYLSEIFHHNGQITYLRGAIERHRETDKHFLT